MSESSANRPFNLTWLLALCSLHLLAAIACFGAAFDHPPDNAWFYWLGVLGVISAWGLVWRTWWGRNVASVACATIILSAPLYAVVEGLPGGLGAGLITLLGGATWLLGAAFCGVSIWRLRCLPEMQAMFRARPERIRILRTFASGVHLILVLCGGLLLHSERGLEALGTRLEGFAEQHIRNEMQLGVDEFSDAVRQDDGNRRWQAKLEIESAGRPFHRPLRMLPVLVREQLSSLDAEQDAPVRRALFELVLEADAAEMGQAATDLYYDLLDDPDVEIRLAAAKHCQGPRPSPFTNQVQTMTEALVSEPDPEIRMYLARGLANSAAYWVNEPDFLEELAIPLRHALQDSSPEVRAEAVRGLSHADPDAVKAKVDSPVQPANSGSL
jgi:hypothetical protein